MTKREKMKEIRQKQKELLKQLANDDKVANKPKRGRRSMSEIFRGVNRHDDMV